MKEQQPSLCEEANFTSVFSEYSKTLFRYLYYKTGNAALSEDLTQEAFAKMWKNCASVIFKTANSYVFTIANNLLLNEYKHQKVVLKFQEKPQVDRTIEDPEYLMEEREWKDKIESAIAALPEKQRTAFLMSRVDKKTYKEIAEVLGISKQAVEKRIYKALDALREVSKKIR